MLSSDLDFSNEAILFIPGALVDPHAYLPLMEQLVEKGMTTIILKVSGNLSILENSKVLGIPEQFPEISSWYLSGHSLGGITALAAIDKQPEFFDGLILMAAYPTEGYSIQTWDKHVLSLYAENDELTTLEQIEENKPFLPSAIEIDKPEEIAGLQAENSITIYYMIKGGNHSQFGAYGAQRGDGVATISSEEQHREICQTITQFIIWNESQ